MSNVTNDVTVSSVGTRHGISTAGTGTTTNAGFDQEMFLKLLVAQLKYQSADSPMDTNQFMAQTMSMSQTESIQTLVKAQKTALLADQSVLGTSMIGKSITASNSLGGADITGTVTGVKLGTDGPVLKVGNTEVALSAVKEVSTPEAAK